MDLIFKNEKREDIGVLHEYDLDLAFGVDENNFECQIPSKAHCCKKNYLLYIEGTEYGGIVDGIGVDTESNTVTYSGRTWHGILSSKVILPLQENEEYSGGASTDGITQDGTQLYIENSVTVTQSGNRLFIDDGDLSNVDLDGTVNRYLIISGDMYDCMRFILDRCGLSTLFSVPSRASGIDITSYRFDRYTDAYNGLKKMLASVGMLLHFAFNGDFVILTAEPKRDFSKDEEFDSDLLDFDLKKQENKVNHLICLGGGELENRLVVHLYADENGNISETQTFFGLDEYTEIYDYANVETAEDLLKDGKQRFKELLDADNVDVNFDAEEDVYNIGDIVGAVDNITGTFISTEITKKIVSIQNGIITVSLETSEPNARMNDVRTTASNAATAAASAKSTARDATNAAANAQAAAEHAQETADSKVADHELLDYIYPVGSIYMSVSSASPSSFIGGTWARIEGRFLLAAGGGYNAGSTGGEATHTLTVDEMPSHTHTYSRKYAAAGDSTSAVAKGASSSQTTKTEESAATGGGAAHNNMPPYLAVYVWKRTK